MMKPEVDVDVDGPVGAPCLVFCHGWPDTAEVWTGTVQALRTRYRCVRMTWPGFGPDGAGSRRQAPSLDALTDHLRQVVLQAGGGQPVTLVLHDWGCVFGYHFAALHPGLVQRVVGLDIGDAGSPAHRRSLGVGHMLMIAGYQLWLALAWKLGSDRMALRMATLLQAPAAGKAHAGMGYPYGLAWTGGLRALRPFQPQVPMFFAWARRKHFMFHSSAWAQALAQRPGSLATGYAAGHWLMRDAADALHGDLARWLLDTDALA